MIFEVRLSTAIAALNYTRLQDAIQATKDESLPSTSMHGIAKVMRMTLTYQGRCNNCFSKFHGQHSLRQNYNNNNQWYSQNKYKCNNFANRDQVTSDLLFSSLKIRITDVGLIITDGVVKDFTTKPIP